MPFSYPGTGFDAGCDGIGRFSLKMGLVIRPNQSDYYYRVVLAWRPGNQLLDSQKAGPVLVPAGFAQTERFARQ
jgi:hypothetical protein